MAGVYLDEVRFTASSRDALKWASLRASMALESSARPSREDLPSSESEHHTEFEQQTLMESEKLEVEQQTRRPAAEVRITDLIAGMMVAHPRDAEPLQLLAHFGASPERLDSLLAQSGFPPSAPPKRSRRPRLSPFPALTPQAENAVHAALKLADSLNPEREHLVRLRDLFGGILLASSEGRALIEQALDESPLDFDLLIGKYQEFLALDAGASTLAGFLAEHYPLPTGGAKHAARMRVALAIPDSTTGEDFVQIGAEVAALAYLIAAKDLHPPLAIGLFGDWGSGKSFFMGELRRRIDAITRAARDSGRAQRDISIFKSVVQIDFNAWHYVEGNLWASLVEHIFRNLQRSAEEPADVVEERQRYWTEQLESQRLALAKSDARLRSLETRKEEAQAAVEQKGKELAKKREELSKIRLADVLAGVELDEVDRRLVSEALETVAVGPASAAARDAATALEDAREVLRRGNALLTPLRDSRAGWRWALLLAAVILAGPLLSLGLATLEIVDLDAVGKVVTSLTGSLLALVGYLRKGTQWFSHALDRVERAGTVLAARGSERRTELAREEAALRVEVEDLEREAVDLRHEATGIQQTIVAIEAELQTITPGRILMDFIADRIGSSDYRKHLGIAATIRRDFDQLTHLISHQNTDFIAEDDGRALEGAKSHLINRIVLYIDDLDRCPPDRVVEVLQAVHLLLAFPLFVVVVAVDSRWLSRSLLSHYATLLASRNGGAAEASQDRATPDDYLEKIFQIPFHVRPLDEGGRGRIVDGLLRDALEDEVRSALPGEEPETPDYDPKAREPSPPTQGPVIESQPEPDREGSLEPGAFDLEPESLRIRKEELEFMTAIRPLLGRTPRAVKRFVNVYRLVKSISLVQGREFGGASTGDVPGYQLQMFLLAVVTGLPAISGKVFHGISGAINDARRVQGVSERRTLGWLAEQLQVTSGAGGATGEIDRLTRWLDTHEDGTWKHMQLSAFDRHLDPVARFSFRTEVALFEA